MHSGVIGLKQAWGGPRRRLAPQAGQQRLTRVFWNIHAHHRTENHMSILDNHTPPENWLREYPTLANHAESLAAASNFADAEIRREESVSWPRRAYINHLRNQKRITDSILIDIIREFQWKPKTPPTPPAQ